LIIFFWMLYISYWNAVIIGGNTFFWKLWLNRFAEHCWILLKVLCFKFCPLVSKVHHSFSESSPHNFSEFHSWGSERSWISIFLHDLQGKVMRAGGLSWSFVRKRSLGKTYLPNFVSYSCLSQLAGLVSYGFGPANDIIVRMVFFICCPTSVSQRLGNLTKLI
jgi:hypothetical protein